MGGNSQQGPLLLTGMGGVLGEGLARGGLAELLAAREPGGRGRGAAAQAAGLVVVGRARPKAWSGAGFVRCDLAVPGAARDLVARLRPRAVLHAAAWSRAAACAADPQGAERMNCGVARELAETLLGLRSAAEESRAAGGAPLPLVYCSTDQVFDGTAERNREGDPPRPLHAYGRSKAAGEAVALAAGGAVVRLPLLLGPRVHDGAVGADTAVVEAARAGQILTLFDDEIRAPADPADLADAFAALLTRPRAGVFHLAGAQAVSRLELGRQACAVAGLQCPHEAGSLRHHTGPPRPPRLVLDCARAVEELGFLPPDLRQSLAHPTRTVT